MKRSKKNLFQTIEKSGAKTGNIFRNSGESLAGRKGHGQIDDAFTMSSAAAG